MTGIHVEGKLHWLQVAATTLLTFFGIGTGLGDVMRPAVGREIHDFGKPYFSILGVRHALGAAQGSLRTGWSGTTNAVLPTW
ncbi:MAG: hypothetical protein OXE94_10705 [Aestuariivita sp.]|nr:hypothetical protein [Aestuariivita sp.]MCY4203183.1 hypothetical protein [Aestuariivita sp.]